MSLPFRRWRAIHLLGAWIAYWALLAAVLLAPPFLVMRRIASLPEGHSNASLTFGNGAFEGKIVADGAIVWQGHLPFIVLALLVVVPPLLLWLAWMVTRPRPEDVRRAELRAGDGFAGVEGRVGRARAEGSKRDR